MRRLTLEKDGGQGKQKYSSQEMKTLKEMG
jgi:hypothetical protein